MDQTNQTSTAVPDAAPKPFAQAASLPVGGRVPQPQLPSHTQENPSFPPHAKSKLAIITPTSQFTRLFLLAWSVRYIPRGLLGELFEKNSSTYLTPVKKFVDKFIDRTVLNRMESKINIILKEEQALVHKAQANPELLARGGEAAPLYDKLKPLVRNWRGDASEMVPSIVKSAKLGAEGELALAKDSKKSLRNLVRGKMDDIGYSLSLFVGSSALSLNYGKLVRRDIMNLYRETVAYEKNVPQEQITFNDIVKSDNRIIQSTIKNYRSNLWSRLGSDAMFLLVTPLKSMHITDLLLGVKGVQMFHDTWQRKTTLFEDLDTFVDNKINPSNGLGQPIGVGELFDLYQHYAQTYKPDRAFTGVIEHASGEGFRWVENQVIFQRLTELMNKTYAYKHQSIVDPSTSKTVNQADFALPKFIYLLGHDMININEPKETLVAIELANSYGIPAVKEMSAMRKQGRSLDDVLARYHVTLPNIQPTAPIDAPNAVLGKGNALQLEHAEVHAISPVSRIDASTALHTKPLALTQQTALV